MSFNNRWRVPLPTRLPDMLAMHPARCCSPSLRRSAPDLPRPLCLPISIIFFVGAGILDSLRVGFQTGWKVTPVRRVARDGTHLARCAGVPPTCGAVCQSAMAQQFLTSVTAHIGRTCATGAQRFRSTGCYSPPPSLLC